MSDSIAVREHLHSLVQADPLICLDQRKLLLSFLQRWERNPFIISIHACCTTGIAQEIHSQQGQSINSMRKDRYVRRLFELRGLHIQTLHWAIETWADTYNCTVPQYNQNIELHPSQKKRKKNALPIRKPLRDPIRMKAHRKEVKMIKFSPDGKWLASASFDRTVRIWDGQKGSPKAILYGGHRERVRALSYRHDGQQLISVGDDFSARIWDMRTGKKGLRLFGHTAPVVRVAYSPDANFLALCSLDKSISIWIVESAEKVYTLGPFSEQPSDFCFDKMGDWFAIALRNRVELWDLSTQQRTAAFPAKGENILLIPSHTGLIIGDERGLRKVDPRSGTHQIQFKGHYKGISALSLDQEEVSLVSAGDDQTLRVWDFDTGKLCWTFDLRRRINSIDINYAGFIVTTFGENFGLLFPMGRGV